MIGMLKDEVIGTLLYGCVTWTFNAKHHDVLQKAHLDAPRQAFGFQRWADHTILLYVKGLQKHQMREHLNDHPETAVLLREGNVTAKRGEITGSDDVGIDSRWRQPGTWWTTESLSHNLKEMASSFFDPPMAPQDTPHGSVALKI